MQPLVYIPPLPLGFFVDKIWYAQADDYTVKGVSLPMLHHELIFNFSDHFSVQSAFHRQGSVANARTWMAGLQTNPVVVSTQGKHEVVGILFKPWGLQPLIGIPAAELVNTAINPEDMLGAEVRSLTGRIAEAPGGIQKVVLIEQFLLKKYSNKPIPAHLIHALNLLKDDTLLEGSIQHVAEKVGVSQKTLIGAFKKSIGVSPKKFLNLQKLNDVLYTMAAHPEQSLTNITYQHDFYDQAHFIRLFKSFTCLTPSEYRRMVLCGRIDPYAPSFIRSIG